ncbi:tetratricopeptide repeat protein [Archangium violaceum]|uniref:NADase-type glycan-binding domain-containing protein n=1 Tax=Archangium violaceum TaxID=83451 RepID=UPI0019503D5E|nr:tetratricopeptide repeat protein [Archangium violaceum]QRN93689.1 tetratricopeptide repeat protein [Archangium violaceum]
MRWFKSFAASLCLAASTAGAAAPEVIITPQSSQFPFIKLTVNVRDRGTGKRIGGLTREAFSVREDMSPGELVSFEEQRQEGTATASPVDVVFVFDQTGSMSEEIAGLVERSRQFADILGDSGFDFRLALVSYSDRVERVFPYTSDVEAFKRQLSKLTADGGDDEPENQLDALVEASKLPHRPGAKKVFLLVTDASFHSSDSITSRTAQGVVESLQSKGVQLHVVGPDLEPYHWMPERLGGTFFDKDSGDFQEIVRSLAGGVAVNYVVSYRSPRPQDDATRRAVEVRVKVGKDTGLDATQYQAPSWVTASSRMDFFAGEESRYAPLHVVDGSPDTVWAEGVPGQGIGEWLHMRFEKQESVSRVALTPPPAGYGCPKEVRLTLGSYSKVVTLEKGKGRQEFDLSPAVSAGSLELEIVSVYGGSDLTGLAEVQVYTGEPPALLERISRSRRTVAETDSAQSLNKKGEQLYHQGKLKESIALYQQAVDKDPSHAQAFSNLGLAYQKVGDFPNAIWANRKAIALARGSGKNGVMASSYYNIARIFEAQGDWKQAEQNFWWANQNRPMKVYDDAILRMQRKQGDVEVAR